MTKHLAYLVDSCEQAKVDDKLLVRQNTTVLEQKLNLIIFFINLHFKIASRYRVCLRKIDAL
jgi:hypothetical protein